MVIQEIPAPTEEEIYSSVKAFLAYTYPSMDRSFIVGLGILRDPNDPYDLVTVQVKISGKLQTKIVRRHHNGTGYTEGA